MREQIGYKDIKLTYHAKERAEERLGITNTETIRKLAVSAKHKGIKLNSLSGKTYEELGISEKLYQKLLTDFICVKNTDACYYHKGIVYIFTGFKSRTLRTVVNLNGI